MFAPVVTRFLTYDVKLDPDCAAYGRAIMALPHMQEWVEAAKAEPDEVVELEHDAHGFASEPREAVGVGMESLVGDADLPFVGGLQRREEMEGG
mgnify:CR=1 FL=1